MIINSTPDFIKMNNLIKSVIQKQYNVALFNFARCSQSHFFGKIKISIG